MTGGPVVMGLDLSVSSTGVARADGTTESLRPKPASMRGGERLDWHAERIAPLLPGVTLLVVEDYSPGSVGIQGKLTNAGLRGVVEREAYRAGVGAIAFVKPATLKRWATGNGGADKHQMVRAAQNAGWTGDPKRDDEADAWHLRRLGLQFLVGGGTPEQQQVCDSIAWPDVPGH